MATSKAYDNNKKLRFDEFTASVKRDPNSSDQHVLLCGYIGKSNLDGHVRVYFDEELNNFVEVPENDILHCIPKDKSEDPLGGSRLWVKQSTVITYGDPASANRPKSSFLEGDLMQAYAASGAGYEGAAAQILPTEPHPTIITGPVSVAGPCITKLPITPCKPTFLKTCFGPTCHRRTCLRTCIGRTCCQHTLQRTCHRTCLGPSCQFGLTCNSPSCGPSCLQPTCVQTQCTPGCGQTIPPYQLCRIPNTPHCVISDPVGCPWPGPGTPQTPVINPGAYGQTGYGDFTGAFNPYNTGY